MLDFGLARMEPARSRARRRRRPMSLSTEPGRVLGTVGYMSPEQVRGQAVDARADIFSFGAVLYEMLTGRRAFRGESRVETMNAILKEDPPSLIESTRNVLACARAHRASLPARSGPRSASTPRTTWPSRSTRSRPPRRAACPQRPWTPRRAACAAPAAAVSWSASAWSSPAPPWPGGDARLAARAAAGGERRRRLPLDELLGARLLARGVAGRPHGGLHLRPRRSAPDLAEAGRAARARPRSRPAPTTPRGSRRTGPRSSSPGPTGRAPRSTARRCSEARRAACSRARPRGTGRPTGSASPSCGCGVRPARRSPRSAWPPRTAPTRARWRRYRAACARPAGRPTDGRSRSCRRRERSSPARSRGS